LTVYKNANELASVKADVVHSGSASDLVEKLVKDKKQLDDEKIRVVYLDERLFRSPSVAVMECDNYT
jgi:6-phosphogluconolactonase/glucosamine-6-phosphate isomerase/deaminase